MKKIIGLLLVIVGVLYLVVSLRTDSAWGIGSLLTKAANDEQRISSEELKNFNAMTIDTKNINVKVSPASGSEAVIRLSGFASPRSNVKLEVRKQDDALSVLTVSSIGFLRFSKATLSIELPAHEWNKFEIKTTSGNIRLEQYAAKELMLQSTSGNLTLDDLTAVKFNAKSTSGNITAKDVETEHPTLKTTSGNIVFSGSTKAINAESTSGNMKLSAAQIVSDSSLKSTSGNIKLRLEEQPDELGIQYKGTSGRGNIKKDGFVYTTVGDKKKSFEGHFGTNTPKLAVQTSSGNFTLE